MQVDVDPVWIFLGWLAFLYVAAVLATAASRMFAGNRGPLRLLDLVATTAPATGRLDLSQLAAGRVVSSWIQTGSIFALIFGVAATAFFVESIPVSLLLVVTALVLMVDVHQRLPARLYRRSTGRESIVFRWQALRYAVVDERKVGTLPWLSVVGLIETVGALLPYIGPPSVATFGYLPFPVVRVVTVSTLPGVLIYAAVTVGVGLILLSSGRAADRRRRRRLMSALAARPRLARLTRKPNVLFLRPFGSEAERIPAAPAVLGMNFALRLFPTRSIALEDCLLGPLWGVAPVVSIGDPRGAREQSLGASRIQADAYDEEWKRIVTDLASTARVIVAVAGNREGMRWELDTVIAAPELRRKVLFVNPDLDDPQGFCRTLVERGAQGEIVPPVGRPFTIGAVFDGSRTVLLTSRGRGQADYESAVQYRMDTLTAPRRAGILGMLRSILPDGD